MLGVIALTICAEVGGQNIINIANNLTRDYSFIYF